MPVLERLAGADDQQLADMAAALATGHWVVPGAVGDLGLVDLDERAEMPFEWLLTRWITSPATPCSSPLSLKSGGSAHEPVGPTLRGQVQGARSVVREAIRESSPGQRSITVVPAPPTQITSLTGAKGISPLQKF